MVCIWDMSEPEWCYTSKSKINIRKRYSIVPLSLFLTNRLAFGNECGLAIVDIVQKTCLLNLGTPDLYGKSNEYKTKGRENLMNLTC